MLDRLLRKVIPTGDRSDRPRRCGRKLELGEYIDFLEQFGIDNFERIDNELIQFKSALPSQILSEKPVKNLANENRLRLIGVEKLDHKNPYLEKGQPKLELVYNRLFNDKVNTALATNRHYFNEFRFGKISLEPGHPNTDWYKQIIKDGHCYHPIDWNLIDDGYFTSYLNR